MSAARRDEFFEIAKSSRKRTSRPWPSPSRAAPAARAHLENILVSELKPKYRGLFDGTTPGTMRA